MYIIADVSRGKTEAIIKKIATPGLTSALLTTRIALASDLTNRLS